MGARLGLDLGGPSDTRRLGRVLGQNLWTGAVAALIGPLGSGKTCLTQGLALGLDVPEGTGVVSPTFTLVGEYDGRRPLYHLDVYRIDVDEFYAAGLDEYLNRGGVTVIEWADRVIDALPDRRLEVMLDFAADGGRTATLIAHGHDYGRLVQAVSQALT